MNAPCPEAFPAKAEVGSPVCRSGATIVTAISDLYSYLQQRQVWMNWSISSSQAVSLINTRLATASQTLFSRSIYFDTDLPDCDRLHEGMVRFMYHAEVAWA